MSLLLNPLLLATLVVIITVSTIQGPPGVPCPQIEVLSGRDGRDGRDGVNGVKGEQGEMGLPGLPGSKGDPGVQGIVGPRGPVGEKGMDGDLGLQGVAGERGEKGMHGVPGIVGEHGYPGPRGVPGEKGMHGVPGIVGVHGYPGPRGVPGEKGMHGYPGPSGVSGERGEKGMRGDPGLRGLQGEQGPQGPATGGVIYTRWGRTTCPTDQGTQLLYAGRAGGTHYDHKGGTANYLCMPNDPDHLQYQSGVQGQSYVAGVEYHYYSLPSLSSNNYHNVPCAVCYVANRSVSVMIPAKIQCPIHWTLEYIGYLMSGRYNHGRTMYECVDKDPESVPGLDGGSDPRGIFYLVEPYCNGLSCPPYDAEKELTCVVCTR